MRACRLLLVMSFTSAFLVGTNLHGQQELDPTWYDPWPEQNSVTTPSQVAGHMNQQKTVFNLPGQPQAKGPINQQIGSGIAGGDRITISAEPQLLTRNGASPSFLRPDEQRIYAVSAVDVRGAVPAPRMADGTALPIATETIYEVKPALEISSNFDLRVLDDDAIDAPAKINSSSAADSAENPTQNSCPSVRCSSNHTIGSVCGARLCHIPGVVMLIRKGYDRTYKRACFYGC